MRFFFIYFFPPLEGRVVDPDPGGSTLFLESGSGSTLERKAGSGSAFKSKSGSFKGSHWRYGGSKWSIEGLETSIHS
jgi:hypothetical protein